MEKVNETTDYSIFRNLDGNRAVKNSHVRRLVEAIRKNDMKLPLIVNKNMEVLDGQHTLEAKKILKKTVQYIIREKLDIQDVRKVNSSQDKWSNTDYLMSYYKLGNKEYALLEWYVRENKLGIMFSVAVLQNKVNLGIADSNRFKEGKFKVTNLENANLWAKRIYEISDYFEYWKDHKFLRAVVTCFMMPEFNYKLFIDKLKNKSGKLRKQASRNDYIVNIERLYNHGTSARKQIRINLYDEPKMTRTV